MTTCRRAPAQPMGRFIRPTCSVKARSRKARRRWTGRRCKAASGRKPSNPPGRRLVVDDNLPTRAGTTDGTVYTTYLFGQGAFAKGAAPLDGTPLQGGFGTEGDRKS